MYTLASFNRKIPAIAIFLFVVFFALTAAQAVATTIYVPDDYPTIQAAVDASNPLDTIIVRDGTYVENVDIGKEQLTIRSETGSSATIIQVADSGYPAFMITAASVEVSGFTIRGVTEWGGSSLYPAAVYLHGATHCLIANNYLDGNIRGIRVETSEHNSILNNTISSTRSRSSGILLYGGKNTVSNNSINVCSAGFWGGLGIQVWTDANNNMLSDNEISASIRGFFVHSVDNVIKGNMVQGSSAFGIGLMNSSNIVCNNRLTANEVAVYVGAGGNTIYLNDITGNTNDVDFSRDNIISNWSSPERMQYTYNGHVYVEHLGNYWSNYSGVDSDQNGVGDTPYVIDGDADGYPLTSPVEFYDYEEPANRPPIADAGSDHLVTVGWPVRLDGSRSTDPDKDQLVYDWSLASVPAGSLAALSDSATPNPTFVPDRPGQYRIDLTVDDGRGGITTDQVVVTATESAGPSELRILFVSDRDGNWEIYSMRQDGSDQQNLTNLSAMDVEPWGSPDGSKIIFSSNRGCGAGSVRLWLMNYDGSNPTLLTGGTESWCEPVVHRYSKFFPDQSKVVFTGSLVPGGPPTNKEIYVMDVDGTNITNLTNNIAEDQYPAVSPDGTKIAFTSDRDGHNEIYIMNADGTNQSRLTYTSGNALLPEFSPDGTKILYTYTRNGVDDIYVMNINGSENKNLTTNPTFDDAYPVFSPDGSKIAFVSARDGNWEVYIMDADGANQTRLTYTPEDELEVAFIGTGTFVDTVPPTLIQNFTASNGEDCQSTLKWTNPADSDLAEIIIRRKTSGYPSDHTDGDVTYQNTTPISGGPVEHVDTGLANGTIYYYSVFSCDAEDNWNDSVQEGENADTGISGPAKFPVLLVHGFQKLPGYNPLDIWQNMAEELSGRSISEKEDVSAFPGHTFWRLSAVNEDHVTVYISNYTVELSATWDNILFYADQLQAELAKIRQEEGVEKVDIVAHSMGGLVARAYIENEDLDPYLGTEGYPDFGTSYANDVRKLIMLGTPNHGAELANIASFFSIDDILGWIAGHNIVSVGQMAVGSEFLDVLNHGCPGCSGSDQLDPDVEHTVLAGSNCAACSIAEGFVLPCLSWCIENGKSWLGFDGVVAMDSVRLTGAAEHACLPFEHSALRVHEDVVGAVEGLLRSLPVSDVIWASEIIQVACPVHVDVTDEQGNVLSDGGTDEIPGGCLSVSADGETKTFYLSSAQNYELTIDAYASGEFSIVELTLGAEGKYLARAFRHIPIAAGAQGQMDVTLDTTPRTLQLDQDGDGVQDQEYTSSVIPLPECEVLYYEISQQGWHMVALPGELCSPCVWAEYAEICGDLICALSDDLDPCYIFYYDPGVGGYVMAPPPESICYHAGMGFWTRTYENDVAIDAEVQVPTEAVEVPLGNGWNQIGNPFTFAVSTVDLKVRCGGTELSLLDAQGQGWVSAYLFGYDTTSGGYVMLDPTTGCLQPWNGYWMRSYQDGCVLIIPPTECSSSALAGEPVSSKELQARGLELPPAPPNDLMNLDVKEVLAGLTVRNVPNPIRSEHTTTFQVEGKGAELVQAIRVDIYDLSGHKVFAQDINAKELEWHTNNDSGDLLANGVYLYQIWVKIADTWYPTGVRKLAVYR